MKLGWKSCQLNSEKAGCCIKMGFWSGKEKDYVLFGGLRRKGLWKNVLFLRTSYIEKLVKQITVN